jgi:hypothetical protein
MLYFESFSESSPAAQHYSYLNCKLFLALHKTLIIASQFLFPPLPSSTSLPLPAYIWISFMKHNSDILKSLWWLTTYKSIMVLKRCSTPIPNFLSLSAMWYAICSLLCHDYYIHTTNSCLSFIFELFHASYWTSTSRAGYLCSPYVYCFIL